MPRTIVRYKPFRQILTAAEPEVMVQLIRLCILYEDLKVEIGALQLPSNKELDEINRHYRQMYFVRRAFATLWEMDSAIHKLQMLPEFKAKKRLLDRRRLKDWTAAAIFFSQTKKFIDRQRNAYGGHVTDEVARFILGKINQNEDAPGGIEVRFSDDHTARLVFKFAEQLVSQALFIDRGEQDHREYLQESWHTLFDAMKHGAHAAQILADLYLLPVFGWGKR